MTAASVHAQFTLDREPAGPSTRKTGMVITEIMYNPLPVPGLETNMTLEFIELYNSKPWNEDISGYRISGLVNYLFPAETVLAPGAYLVLARVPELIQSHYGITNVVGPWDGAVTNRLSTERGLVELRNRQDAVLLSVDYRDSPPWPEGSDGTGHSLNLARPSFGEAEPRAWAQSDSMGGSPGGPDPLTPDPLAAVVINEWQNHSDPSDWIELYNHGNTAVNLSGAYLSDAPASNFFRIPDGTSIPARGHLSWAQEQLGFELFAGGETIFFWSSNRTRLLDVIDFRGQSNNVTSGRSPDGGPFIYGLATSTRNGPNSRPLQYPVVINEIMYNPISGNTDEEYIELYNRGSRAVDISGWQFVVGIDYVFPTNSLTASMPAGAYWIVAKNPELLMSIYPNLTTNNTFGPYGGTLANGGERVLFTAADYDNVNGVIEKLPVPVSEVNYGDGGKWGQWSDGNGSSLELIDPQADTLMPSNWADSNDTDESQWTAIEMNVPLGESLGTPINDSLIIMTLGIGECLLDEVEVRVDNGPNLVANGGFESGLTGWSLQGSHDFSTVENKGFAGNSSLHVRAASRGENQSNRILSAPFASPIPPSAGIVSLRAKVKWLRGFPEILLRLHGSATEAYGRMALPRHLGTPGMINSRYVGNAGPAVYDVKHAPLLPSANQPVVITARATDPQNVPSLKVRYRLDPSPDYLEVVMVDNGTAGDAIANDGLFSATIPGQEAGGMVAFYVEARDSLNAVGTFPQYVFPQNGLDRCWPNDAVARECVLRWGEMQMPGDFATYHLWVSAVNSNRWHTRAAMNNADMDGTFVYNNSRVVYNALPLYSGSPWHRTNSTTGPAGINRVDYEMNFPDDDPFLGATDFVLNNPGNPDQLTVSDLSAVAEQTVYKIFEGMGLVHNHRRYIHFFVNGSQRSKAYEREGNFIFEDSQQPNGDMIDEWFGGGGGQLFKVEDWFEMDPNGFDVTANNDADMQRRTVLIDGQPTFLPGTYRFMYRKRSVGVGNSANDFSQIYELIDAVSPADNPDSPTMDPDYLGTVVDWEAWMRHFAVQRTVGNWDSFGWERGKNDYLYRTGNGFVHMPWDIDYSLGLGRPADEPLFESNDPRVLAMFNTPAIVRAYWRAFSDIISGPFSNEYLDPFIDERVDALLANNIDIDLDAVETIKTYISERRDFLQAQLATVQAPFALDGSSNIVTDNNLLILTGTAPVEVKNITINGVVYPITWTSANTFQLQLVVETATNAFTVQGLDRFGQDLEGASLDLNVEYTGPIVDPAGALIISEIMYDPATPGAGFIEIMNRSAQNFNLWGWRLDGLNYIFPPGSILTNGQIAVLAQDRGGFGQAYGNMPVFAEFGFPLSTEEQRIVLVKPDSELGDLVVDAVRYEGRAPWPVGDVGVSLQLIDVTQDNSRSSNWAFDPVALATPGAPNSVAADMPAYDPVWLNEVQSENLTIADDINLEFEPWIELYNAGTEPVSLEGYYLAQDYENNLTQWAFPAGTMIAPGEYKLIWADGQPEQSEADDLHTDFRLDYSGKLALVRMVEGLPQITDYLTWAVQGGNASYGDDPDGQPVDRYTLFQATPRSTNVLSFPQVFVNEYMAAPTSGEDWFEIYNGGTQTIDLRGYYLSDDGADPTQFAIPNNGPYQIPPRGFLLVWADDQADSNGPNEPELHVNFKLSGGGEAIVLTAPDGVTVVDSVQFGLQTDGVSEGRYSDGASTFFVMAKPTPGTRNTVLGFNSPPVFLPIDTVFIPPGGRQTFPVYARDPDYPAQTLTYGFQPMLPGAAVNASGLFRWIVPTNQPSGEYVFDIWATDNGVPPRTGYSSFSIVVQGPTPPVMVTPPLIRDFITLGDQMTLTFSTEAGRTYRILYKNQFNDPEWIQIDRDFVAANPTASITDALITPQRFYQVQLVQ